MQTLSDDVDGLVKAVDRDKIRAIVGNVGDFTASLGRNQGNIDSTLSNAASLAKKLNDAAGDMASVVGHVDELAKALDGHKIAGVIDDVSAFAHTLDLNRPNIDRTLKDAAELAGKLDKSADQVDALMRSLQGFVGSPETKGALTQVGDAARSVRQLADDLNQRTKEIAQGLTKFTGSGLREYEALAVDGRRTLNDFDRLMRSLERNPTQLIFGAKPALPEYHGGK